MFFYRFFGMLNRWHLSDLSLEPQIDLQNLGRELCFQGTIGHARSFGGQLVAPKIKAQLIQHPK